MQDNGAMALVTFVSPQGSPVATVQAKPGHSVMQAALAADVRGIEAECGGSMTCATCNVYVADKDAARIPAASADELAMLDFAAAERRPTSRLSCQIVMTDEIGTLEVQLPDRQV